MANFTKPTSPAVQPGNLIGADLVRCFLCDEGSGTTLADVLGNDLTLKDGGSTMTGPQAAAAWNGGGSADGTYGDFVRFNGTSQRAEGSDTGLAIGTADRAWLIVYRATTGSSGVLASYGGAGDGSFGPGANGGIAFNELDVTTLNQFVTSGAVVADTSIRRCIVSVRSGLIDFWDNGTVAATGLTLASFSTVLAGATGLHIADIGGAAKFGGDIFSVQVMNRSATSADNTALESDWYQGVRGAATSMSPSTATIAVGATQLFTPTGLTGSILWDSSAPSVATIPAGPAGTQTATAVGVGSTTIGATDGTNGASATLTVVPAAPTITSVTGGNTQNTIAFATAGTGGTTFDLYRGTTAGGEGGSPVATGITSPHADTGLTNGTTYFYKLKASNNGGSAFSNEMSGTPSASPALAPATLSIGLGSTQTFSASGFTGGTVTLASGTPSVMSVSGMVGTAAGIGSATITATGVTNPAQTATAAVTVVAVRNYFNTVEFSSSGLSPTLSYRQFPGNTDYSWSGLAVYDIGDKNYAVYGTIPALVLSVKVTAGSESYSTPWDPTAEGLFTAAGAATLAQSFPSNFSTLAIDGSGRVTAATVVDKAGYSLAAAGLDAIPVEAGINARQALALKGAVAAGKSSGFDPDNLTSPVTYFAMGSTTVARVVATVDANGNRTVTLTPPA